MDIPQQTPTPYTSPVTPTPTPFVPPPAPPPVTTPPPSGSHTGMLVGILVAVIVLAAAYFFFFLKTDEVAMVSPSPSESVTPSETPSPTPTPDPTAGWQTYTNTTYGYQIQYPENWIVDTTYSNSAFTQRGPEKENMGGDTVWSNYASPGSYDLGNRPADLRVFCGLYVFKDANIDTYMSTNKPQSSVVQTVLTYEVTDTSATDKRIYQVIDSKDHPTGIQKNLSRIVQIGANLYLLSCFPESDSEKATANEFLSTFKFTQ